MNYSQFRLKYGMHWKRSYPTPLDYKTETRWVAALLLVIFMLWLAVSTLSYQDALIQTEMDRDSAQELKLACLNQAYRADRYGEQMKIGWVADGMLIGVDCTVYSRDAHKNVRAM